jgi:FixJ family two-component response regulator
MTQNATTEMVCLVEDDPAVLKSIGRLLVSDGLVVHSFNDPKSFLAHVAAHQVPLAVLDIWMEEMTGLELQERVRVLSPNTRIIIMTGRHDRAAKNKALDAGAVAFFIKPFDDEEFLAAMRGTLAMNSR